MAKKEFFILIDTETTIKDKVFDFAALVVDRKGEIYHSVACIVNESAGEDLFYDVNSPEWSRSNAMKKREAYAEMVNSGRRHVYSVSAINRWLEKINAKYNPALTAYNVAFDNGKCANTQIDLSIFKSQFCLWHLACEMFANKKAFMQFAMDNHYFGNRTAKGNMTIKTNAEIMAHFVTGQYNAEPHTALEDAQFFELPILVACVNKKGWKNKIGRAYNWRNYQLKDHYKA